MHIAENELVLLFCGMCVSRAEGTATGTGTRTTRAQIPQHESNGKTSVCVCVCSLRRSRGESRSGRWDFLQSKMCIEMAALRARAKKYVGEEHGLGMSVQRGIAFRFLRQNQCRCICKSVWALVCVSVCRTRLEAALIHTYYVHTYVCMPVCEPVYLPPRCFCCCCCDFLQSLSLLWLCVLLLLFFLNVACRLSFCLRFNQHRVLLLLFLFPLQ